MSTAYYGGGSSAAAAAASVPSQQQTLAFRVMRLCRPSIQTEDTLLCLDPADLLVGEEFFSSGQDSISSESILQPYSSAAATDFSFRHRFHLDSPGHASGLSGLLVLPQSFGSIYLGETFCSYISINNSSSFEARDVIIKAEIQTERQRIVLLDTSKSPIESIRAGGRYDFIIEHDVKELGPHTLVCTAVYNDGDSERKYLPQFFKFVVANPLSVRTKVRTVKDNTFLEACIENHTKSNLYMDQVEFEPAQQWTATMLKSDEHPSKVDSKIREIFRPPVLIRAGGGMYNYLYQLKASSESGQMKTDGGNILGKLQITWKTNLGESGRLQTQQILGTPVIKKDIDLQVKDVPSFTILERPFKVHLALTNQTDKVVGPFEVFLSQGDSRNEKAVMVNGVQKLVLPPVEPFDSTTFELDMIATRLGIQNISGITLFDQGGNKVFEPLPDIEIFVDRE